VEDGVRVIPTQVISRMNCQKELLPKVREFACRPPRIRPLEFLSAKII
jgi:hypothetical protein